MDKQHNRVDIRKPGREKMDSAWGNEDTGKQQDKLPVDTLTWWRQTGKGDVAIPHDINSYTIASRGAH